MEFSVLSSKVHLLDLGIKKREIIGGFGIKGLFFEVPMFMTLSEVTLPRRKKFRLGYNLG